MKRTGISASRPRRLLKAVTLLPALALAFSLAGLMAAGSAQAIPLLGPEPTGMSPASVCVGQTLNFTGHEFYPTMTANFGVSGSANVFNITIPIGDNDTAQAVVPSIPAGTYTVTLSDRYGTGTVPGTLTVLGCAVQGGGNWNTTKSTLVFHPPLVAKGKTRPSLGTTKFALTDPIDMLVIDTSAKAALSLTLPTNTCAALDGSTTATATVNVTWQPDSISASTVSFTGFTVTQTSTGGISLNFGGPGTSATGSYADTDGGASSTMTLTSPTTPDQLAAACAGQGGLKSLLLSAGSLSIQ